MKRSDIQAQLTAAGITDEAVIKQIVDKIMDTHSSEIGTARQAGADERQSEIDGLNEQLKAFAVGGEKYIDAKEFERLKTFESDTKAKAERDVKAKALNSFLTAEKVKSDFHKLVEKSVDFSKMELDEKGNFKADYAKQLKESLKADCPTAFDTVEPGTGNPFNGGGNPPPRKGLNATAEEWTAAINESLAKNNRN